MIYCTHAGSVLWVLLGVPAYDGCCLVHISMLLLATLKPLQSVASFPFQENHVHR